MTYEAIIKRRVRGDTHVCLLIVACLFSCWLASTQHAQSAITPLMKPDPWSQNIITQKVQIILQIKMKSVFKDRICGLITEDFTYDYEINSEGTFQYAPDFSLFSLYGYNEALAPKQIRIRDASGYWIRFESGCQGGTRHNYSTHQVQYNDWAYYDLRIEHPPRSEHCNVYFDNHVYLRFPGYSGNVLTSPEPGFYYDTENIDYMVTPAIMQQAVREGSYHKTLQVRRGDGSEYRDLTLDITVLFEPKEEGVLKVTPPDGLDDSCPSSNCDFKSLAKSYTLTNAGSSPINYTVSKTASWLELTSTGGVLQPGASTTVTASISVEAQKELKEGVHKDTLVFTNTTNGKGNTSRAVKLEKSERQCWRVTLAGQETDDMGGSLMTIKMENVWKQVTVDYGVRFDYQLVAEFNIKKKDGAWVYNEGRIVEAKVGLSQNFDPDVFFISKMVCQNCNKIANLKGQSLSGSVQGQTVNLKWPDVMTSAIVTNKIKLKFVSKEKSQEGYSDNYFISEDFFHWTWTHNLPLIDNKEVKFQMEKKNSKSRFKLDKRPPISLYYRYVLKKIK